MEDSKTSNGFLSTFSFLALQVLFAVDASYIYIYLSIYMSNYMFIYLPIYLSIYLYIYLSQSLLSVSFYLSLALLAVRVVKVERVGR